MWNCSPNKNTCVAVDCANDNGPFALYSAWIYISSSSCCSSGSRAVHESKHKHKHIHTQTQTRPKRRHAPKEREREPCDTKSTQEWDNQWICFVLSVKWKKLRLSFVSFVCLLTLFLSLSLSSASRRACSQISSNIERKASVFTASTDTVASVHRFFFSHEMKCWINLFFCFSLHSPTLE